MLFPRTLNVYLFTGWPASVVPGTADKLGHLCTYIVMDSYLWIVYFKKLYHVEQTEVYSDLTHFKSNTLLRKCTLTVTCVWTFESLIPDEGLECEKLMCSSFN